MPYQILDPTLAQAAPVTTLAAPLTSVGETLATLDAELDLEIGARDDVDQPRRYKWINWAYRNLCASVDLKELYGSVVYSTVDTKYLYNLPIQVSFTKRVSVIDETNYPDIGGRELAKIDLAKYRKLDEADDDTPSFWFAYRRMLIIYPAADAVYTISLDAKLRPDDLVNPTDSPILPIEWHEGLLLMARYRAFRSVRMFREAAMANNDYLQVIRPMLNTDAEERESEQAHFSPARKLRDLYRGRGQ